jgi:hypothetical protein
VLIKELVCYTKPGGAVPCSKNQSLDQILIYLNLVCALTHCYFNVSSNLRLMVSVRSSLHSSFPTKFCTHPHLHVCYIPHQLFLLHFIFLNQTQYRLFVSVYVCMRARACIHIYIYIYIYIRARRTMFHIRSTDALRSTYFACFYSVIKYGVMFGVIHLTVKWYLLCRREFENLWRINSCRRLFTTYCDLHLYANTEAIFLVINFFANNQ